MRKESGAIAGLLTLIFSAADLAGGVPEWSPEELRGRTIYRTGVSPSGQKIRAFMGGGATEVGGDLMPCANCHGLDGRGRPESGVVPSSLRWADLTRPYDTSAASGRRRGPYDERLLVRAITIGVDSAGTRLGAGMPRFSLSRADAGDLVAYLRKISADHDPGLTDDSIGIGVVLPSESGFPAVGAAIRSALNAYFSELNRAGGIYGRRIEITARELPGESSSIPAVFDGLARDETVFALLSSFVAGAENRVTAILRDGKLPLVGAWTLLPPSGSEADRYIYYSDAGVPGQAASLASWLIDRTEAKPALVVADDDLSQGAADAVKARLTGSAWPAIETNPAPVDAAGAHALVRRLTAEGADQVFLLVRRPELVEILHAAARDDWRANFLIPGGLAGLAPEELRSIPGSAILALPFLPSDVTPEAAVAYEKLAKEYALPAGQLAAQLRALAEASVLVEGLKRAGRDLSRERLMQALEGLYDFAPGFSRPLSFGTHRKTGSTEFHLVAVDPLSGSIKEIEIANKPR